MRQIKFRGKAKTGEWFEGDLVYAEQEDTYYIGVTELLHPVLPETVGQFTGLHDKNGKEIYEGDLLTITDPYNDRDAKGFARVVFSYEYAGGWVVTGDNKNFLNIGTRTKYVAVSGNIHDNSELMEQ